jgi:Flp pilus assembly pilin Flp
LHIQILCPRLWVQDEIKEGEQTHGGLLTVYVRFQTLASSEEGQDLVEYALHCCSIALAVITGVNNVATAVMNVFTNVSSSLA